MAYLVACLIIGLGCLSGALKAFASSEITATGNTAGDAVVTDDTGKVVTDTNNLSKYQTYNVKWNFSIPNSEQIAAGDTLTFHLPEGMTANGNLNFDVKNSAGDVIGTFSIAQGSNEGTLTFNNYFATHNQVSRHGTIQITANGSKVTTQQGWHVNKIAYINGSGKVTYNIAINAGDTGYTKVVLNDNSNLGQKVIPSSVVAQEGYYDAQGKFVATSTLSPQVVVNGSNTQFVLNNVKGIVNITYNVDAPNSGVLKNAVAMDGYTENGGGTPETYNTQAEISYNGSGNMGGDNQSSSSSVSSSSSSKVESSSSSVIMPSSSSVVPSSSSKVESSSSNVTLNSSSNKHAVVIAGQSSHSDHNQSNKNQSESTKNNSSKLPQTGDANSTWMVVAGFGLLLVVITLIVKVIK